MIWTVCLSFCLESCCTCTSRVRQMVQRPFKALPSLSRDEWLTERRKYLTASSVATVLGKNPFESPEAFFARLKSGDNTDRQPSKAMWWGTQCEGVIMSAYGHVTGARIRPCGRLLVSTAREVLAATPDGFIRHPEWPKARSGASPDWCEYPDGVMPPSGTLGVIEAKNVSFRSRRRWEHGPPEYYWWQVQAQLYVTGLDYGVLVAKIDASDLMAYVIRPTDEARAGIEMAVNIWKENMGHV